jgi:hypothetical protein
MGSHTYCERVRRGIVRSEKYMIRYVWFDETEVIWER